MFSQRRKVQKIVIMMIDVACIISAYILSGIIRHGILNEYFLHSVYGTVFITAIPIYMLIYVFSETGEPYFFQRGFYIEFCKVVKEQITLGILLLLYMYLTQVGSEYSRLFFLVFLTINTLLIFTIRCYFKLSMLTLYKNSNFSSKVMVITTSDLAEATIRHFNEENFWSIKVMALCIVDKDMIGKNYQGVVVTTGVQSMYAEALLSVVDEVFIYVPQNSTLALEETILNYDKMGIQVHLNLNIYGNLNLSDKMIGKFAGFHVVTFASKLYDIRKLLVKTLIDAIGGIVGTVLTGVLIIILGPIIFIESPGPIFFSQTRIGKNGRQFKIYKFRSMHLDAEDRKKDLEAQNEMNGLMFKMKDDPRVTRIGRFLRKTSLDEFPQFINVIKGEMSLVGTRPPTYDEFQKYKLRYKRRLSIKPGLTGLWQVSGRSDITDFEEVVKLDLEYIDNWSLGLDMKILVKTVVVMLFGRGAK